MGLPWTTILLHGPTIVEAARKLYATARRPPVQPELAPGDAIAVEVESLRQVLETLTEQEVQHAALLTDLARQVQQMRARLALALVGAACAVAMSCLAVALAVWR
jgi:2-phosphoglycerate kinase